MATAFNLTAGQEAARNLFTVWLNIGTSIAKDWACVGAGVEDASMDVEIDKETTTDILGVTRTKINSIQRSMSFDSMTITGGDEILLKLHNLLYAEDPTALSNLEVMVVHGYVGAAGSYEAELFPTSAVTPTSWGGTSTVQVAVDIDFGGAKLKGTSSTFLPTSTPVWTPAV